MTAYRPDRRDPLVQRFARSVSDTLDDPYAYSEGPAEPQRLVTDDDQPRDSVLVRWGPLVIAAIAVLIVLGVI